MSNAMTEAMADIEQEIAELKLKIKVIDAIPCNARTENETMDCCAFNRRLGILLVERECLCILGSGGQGSKPDPLLLCVCALGGGQSSVDSIVQLVLKELKGE